MNLQPVAAYFLPDAWSIGYSGNILANWKNPASDTFTVPIGVSVAKVVKLGKLPVRLALGVQWMPVQPDATDRSGTSSWSWPRCSRSWSRAI